MSMHSFMDGVKHPETSAQTLLSWVSSIVGILIPCRTAIGKWGLRERNSG
jgi:hypothetical protein